VSFRPREERVAPPATPVTDVAITRFEHVFEVEPGLMTEHVTQQPFPNWDTLRIVRSRLDHLEWMHEHWASKVISGEELLADDTDGGSTVG
jgi:hypothetical protein